MLVFFVTLAFAARPLGQEETIRTKPLILCPENEIWVKCKTVCPPQFCNISYTTYGPCEPNPKCESGCDCQKDYLRDNFGVCVLNDRCPPPVQCGENQVPSDCADNYSPDPKITVCESGCRCIEGYVRNTYDECVPTPVQCGENQVPSDCADNYSPDPKITVCESGCRCIEGYVRNTYDECVPIPPVLECGKYGEPAACKKVCPPLSCGWDPTKYACKPGPCQPGCNCIKGYLQNEEGVCIPEGQCPQKCPEFEEPTECSKNLDSSDPAVAMTAKCRPCQCIADYVRDNNGVCVPKDQFCESDRNTTYTLCPNRCISTCSNPNGVCSLECREGYGCGCKPGYLLSDDKKCILPQDCPGGNPCKENQEFVYCNAGCPTLNCPENDNLGEIACDPPIYCPSGCACKRNYKWDSDKREKCILASECPPLNCTRENEVWNSCPPPCFSDKCRDLKPTVCWDINVEPECKPQCACRDGYRRDDNGKCVLISQCPSVCGEGEEPSECGDNYPRTLAVDEVAVERIRCLPGCKCKKGYTRNNKGVCVPSVCGENERPNICPDIFPRGNCPRCVCIKGYTKNKDGKCVKEPQCGTNEVPNECALTPTVASDTSVVVEESTEKIRCQPCRCADEYTRDKNGTCVKAEGVCGANEEPNYCIALLGVSCAPCRCKIGYVYDSNGVCVIEPKCGTNEVPNECAITPTVASDTGVVVEESTEKIRCQPCRCADGYTRDKNGTCVKAEGVCGANEEPNYCIALLGVICAPCRCKSGYVYDSNGVCVIEPPKCKPFEVWNSCTRPGFTDNCYEDSQYSLDDYDRCVPRCVCQQYYARNKTSGLCIPIRECPICGENEMPNICPAIFPSNCPRCVCIKGFIKNKDGKCVKALQCGTNEVPNECALTSTVASDTSVVVEESTEKIRCQPCRCADEYTRDKNGTCVKAEGVCGANEEPNYCIALLGVSCAPCRCKSGYVYDSNGVCVIEPKCGTNEVPNECAITPTVASNTGVVVGDSTEKIRCQPCRCADGYTRDKNGKCVKAEGVCGANEEPNYCIALLGVTCAPCRCKSGYVYDSNGVCVIEPPKCKPFEVWNSCTRPGFTDNCYEDSQYSLDDYDRCVPRCVCQQYYARNKTSGLCIPIRECPLCGENEMPNICPAIFPSNCPRCVCIKGFIKNKDGKCVKAPQCGTNEVPNECALTPTTTSDTSVVSEESAEKIRCQPCKCADGYKRDINGTCVREEVVCGINEEPNFCIALYGIYCPPCRCKSGYVYGINGQCVKDTQCGEYEEPNDCSIVTLDPATSVAAEESADKIRCQPCVCRKNYIRDKEGKCVLNLQCGENEEASHCKQLCPPDTCGWDSTRMECRQPVPCEAGCNCKIGFKRDVKENCIPEDQCPQSNTS